MNLRDRSFERRVRKLVRAQATLPRDLLHPADVGGWVLFALFVVFVGLVCGLSVVILGYMSLLFIARDVVAASDHSLRGSRLPLDAVLSSLSWIYLAAVPIWYGTTYNYSKRAKLTLNDLLHFLPVPDSVILRAALPRSLWWCLFGICAMHLAQLEWYHGSAAPVRWVLLPVIAVLQVSVTMAMAGIVDNVLQRFKSPWTAMASHWIGMLLVFGPLYLATSESEIAGEIWQSSWNTYLPTAWGWSVWRYGLSGEAPAIWLVAIPAFLVWWLARWLIMHVPISASRVEALLYGDQAANEQRFTPVVQPSTGDSELLPEHVRAALVSFQRPARSRHEQWLNWPTTGLDRMIAEARGWVLGGVVPERIVMLSVVGPLVISIIIARFIGTEVPSVITGLLLLALLSNLILSGGLRSVREGDPLPVCWDDRLMAAIRFSLSHVKRYVPWLVLSGVFLVIYEELDIWSTVAALGIPYVIVVIGSPLMVVVPQLLLLPVRFAERFGLRTFMLLLILLIVVFAAGVLAVGIGIDRLLPADRASENARLAVLGCFFVGWVLISTLLSRCVYRYTKLDIE